MSTSCMKRKVASGGGGGGGGGGGTQLYCRRLYQVTLPIKFRACNRFSGF